MAIAVTSVTAGQRTPTVLAYFGNNPYASDLAGSL